VLEGPIRVTWVIKNLTDLKRDICEILVEVFGIKILEAAELDKSRLRARQDAVMEVTQSCFKTTPSQKAVTAVGKYDIKL
jgi:hypothetical protein